MDKRNISNKSSFMARGGIYIALSIIILYSTTFFPFNTILLMGIASAIIPLTIITTDLKTSVIVYVAVSLLSYFLLPLKSVWLCYLMFFGIFGFIKYYIEGFNLMKLEIFLKLLFFNIVMFLYYYIYKLLFAPETTLPPKFALIIIVYQFLFLIYDYSLTIFITYVDNNFINKIKK